MYVRQCIESGYVSSAGPFVGRFEDAFAQVVGAPHAVACASGTAALHVALQLSGEQPPRMVAVSTFTFIASANAATYTGAQLLLVDSEPDTWNMNTQMLRDHTVRSARMGKRIPDVIEVVHVLGHPADMEPLWELRDRFGITIVEDAAESLGAGWKSGTLAGQHTGTAGQMGCFSFNGNKIVTSGGGGMIVTADADLAAKARHLTTQAKKPGEVYVHDAVGYNYRLTNLAAALGLAQLERLPQRLRSKRAIAAAYNALLGDLPITLPPRAPWATPSHWLYTVLLRKRFESDELVAAMAANGIQMRRVWAPLHRQPPYRKTEILGGGEVADDLYWRGVSLPSSAHLDAAQQNEVCEAFRQTVLASTRRR
nr:DegT/DnrJ/EryC1/StrS family aminotransferase [Phytoactinopolyspora alkaliphila]